MVGKVATNYTNGWSAEAQFVAATVAGGTASVVGGGRFENGATTAAFGYLFNACARGCDFLRARGYDPIDISTADGILGYFERPILTPTGARIISWSDEIIWNELTVPVAVPLINTKIDLTLGLGTEIGRPLYQHSLGIEIYQATVSNGRVMNEKIIGVMPDGYKWIPNPRDPVSSRSRYKACVGQSTSCSVW